MAKQLFLNLPVKNLARSVAFFTQLGFTFNPQFTDKNATCMIVADNIYVMLLVNKFFKRFIKKEVANAKKTTEVLIALSVESRADVDRMMRLALKAGGKEPRPAEDHGWMYGRDFEDPDGHTWEVFYMDKKQMPKK